MRTVKVKIHCPVCGKFKIEHEVDTNEYGYFAFPTALCPECCAILVQDIDGDEGIKDASECNTQ